MSTPALPSLSQAIADVEASVTALSAADTAQATANQKFDAAKAAKDSADSDDAKAVETYNTMLDALIAAATANKR
jgi:hypothetical protein